MFTHPKVFPFKNVEKYLYEANPVRLMNDSTTHIRYLHTRETSLTFSARGRLRNNARTGATFILLLQE